MENTSISDVTARSDSSAAAGNVFRRLREDIAYRRTFTLTISVYYSYVMLGWVVLQIGTSLPDLQLLVRIDLETASWLFTSWSLGFVTGSLICGFLYDKWNRLALMMTASFGCAICTVCLPYSASFPVMVIFRFCTGICTGSIDTGANTIVPTIWGVEGRPYMQALYFAYTFGGILSPLVTKPFMSPKHRFDTVVPTMDTRINGTWHANYTIGDAGSIEENSNITYTENHSWNGTTIHNAFLITGVLVFTSALPYVLMLCKGGYDKRADHNIEIIIEPEESPLKESTFSDKQTQEERTNKLDKLSGYRKIFVLACVAWFNFMYSASEDSLGDFLVTFCRDYLDWENTASVTLMSLYWIASCVGGLSGVVLVKILGPTKLLFIALLSWNCAFLASLIASLTMVDILVWIFIPTSGFFMVLIIPTIISWTEENVCTMSGKVSALLMISTGTGMTANPNFIGYMMEEYSYVCFIYILLAESIICSMLYTSAYIGRHLCKGSNKDSDIESTVKLTNGDIDLQKKYGDKTESFKIDSV